MRALPLAARAYLIATYVAGLGALDWYLFGDPAVPRLADWLLAAGLAAAAAVAQLLVVLRSGGNHSDHLTPAPLFAAFLLLPAPLVALVIGVTFVPEWIYYRRKWFIQCFNIASWLVAAAAGRGALLVLAARAGVDPVFPLPAPLIAVVLPVVLGTQTLLLAWALKLARGHSFRESGLFAPGKLAVEGGLLCAGWSFAVAWAVDPLYGVAAAMPLGLIFQALHVPNLRAEAATDPKTGLANMRQFNALLVRDLERAERSGQPASLLMCDLDYLRSINNAYGHQAGDIVLRGIADVIRRTIRACDVAARFGGEEFVVWLADTDSAGARQVAERLRREIEQAGFALGPQGPTIGATMSIGVASFPGDGRTAEPLLREADLAVYQAKREGRNRVVVAGRTSRELAGEWAREHLMPAVPVLSPAAPAGAGGRRPLWRLITEATRLSAVTQGHAEGPAGRLVPAARPRTPAAAGEPGRADPPAPAPRSARGIPVLIGAVVSAGLLGLLVDLAPRSPATAATAARVASIPWLGLALFAGLSMLTQHLAIDVDQKRGKISVNAVAVLGASFLHGGWGALATVAAFALWAKYKAGSPLHRMLFNFGMGLLAAEGAAWTFGLLVGQPVAQTPFDRMLLPAATAGLVYYAINHALLCLVRGLAEGRRPLDIWLADYQWLWPHYAVFGALGLVVAVGYQAFGWAGVLALMAPVGMMHVAMKQYTARTAVYIDELRRTNARLGDSYESTLQALTSALDTRDEETEEHSQRVRRYAELIARKHGVPPDEIEHISRGALLHDIGKIGVPDAILLKPGRLTTEELAVMRRHPTIGYAMIAHIPFLAYAAQVVLHHHEAYDGSGYPSGLSGERIPLGARIFAVADALDAMTSDRPYRKALTCGAALAEIARCRGRQFDPRVVDTLLAVPLTELLAAKQGPQGAAEPAARRGLPSGDRRDREDQQEEGGAAAAAAPTAPPLALGGRVPVLP